MAPNRAVALAFVFLMLVPGVGLGAPPPSARSAARQEPARAEVESLSRRAGELLASYDARERAWGAYLAGKFGFAEHVPAISAALDSAVGGDEGSDTSYVRRAALDALIRLRADVGAELLTRTFQSNQDESAVLLCYSASAEADQRAMLGLLKGAREPTWVAFCNVLAEQKAPGFTARLLADLTITLEVDVSDDGRTATGPERWTACGDGLFTVPDGFPPMTLYHLDLSPGGFVVASGPRPVFCYTTTAEAGRTIGVGGCAGSVDWNAYRLECLAAMLDVAPDAFGLRAVVPASVAWKGAAAYEAEIRERVGKIESEVARAKSRLRNAGLLDATEAASATPRVSIDAVDRRRIRSPRLPAVGSEANE